MNYSLDCSPYASLVANCVRLTFNNQTAPIRGSKARRAQPDRPRTRLLRGHYPAWAVEWQVLRHQDLRPAQRRRTVEMAPAPIGQDSVVRCTAPFAHSHGNHSCRSTHVVAGAEALASMGGSKPLIYTHVVKELRNPARSPLDLLHGRIDQ